MYRNTHTNGKGQDDDDDETREFIHLETSLSLIGPFDTVRLVDAAAAAAALSVAAAAGQSVCVCPPPPPPPSSSLPSHPLAFGHRRFHSNAPFFHSPPFSFFLFVEFKQLSLERYKLNNSCCCLHIHVCVCVCVCVCGSHSHTLDTI